MNGEIQAIIKRIDTLEQNENIRHVENKKNIDRLFKVLDEFKTLVLTRPCKTHEEKMKWLTYGLLSLWSVFILGGLVTVFVNRFLIN